MFEWFHRNLEHALCVLLLMARLGDVLTTYFATPRLKLEANPIVRKLGWKYALLTILVCLVPYYNVMISVPILVASLLVSASNAGKIWLMRSLGEDEWLALLEQAAQRGKLRHALLALAASFFFLLLLGTTLILLSPPPRQAWGFWFGCGILLYAFAISLHGALFYRRLYGRVSAPQEQPPQGSQQQEQES